MKVLVSPSDSELAGVIGSNAILSPLPEGRGADVLLFTKQGSIGIQRKVIPGDFLQSLGDGRMARATSLLPKACKFCLLLCEGKFKYFADERLALYGGIASKFTKSQIHGILFNIKYVKGVDYDYTEDIYHTARYIKFIGDFMSSDKHMGLFTRPGAKGTWTIPSVDEVHSWLVQGFTGIGPATAEKIIRVCGGGKAPLRWSCTYEQLLSVPGLSKKRAREIWELLEGPAPVQEVISVFDKLRKDMAEKEQ